MARITNPLNDKQFERLYLSVEWSDLQLIHPKRKRIEAIKQFLGFHYSDGGTTRRVPVNFIKLAISIYVRLLAARAPRVLFSTRHPTLEATAANLELAVNEVPEEIKLRNTYKRAVTEALFSVGVVKVGLHTVGEILGHAYGTPFVDVITQDDLILDMAAKHWEALQYIGNSYWLDHQDVMESKWFPKKNLNGLEPDDFTVISDTGEESAQSISISESATLFKRKIELRDVFIPSENVMVTYTRRSKKLLKVFDWEGPNRGPYEVLGFDWVPGNLLPVPPVATWRDLHELGNNLFLKLGQQADSQKTVQGFGGNDDEGVTNFKNARDGDGIKYAGGEPKLLKAGGVDPTTLMFYLQAKDLSSYFAGNIDAAGGLAVQSETLGQDKLLNEAASAQLREMASEVIEFSKEVFRALGHWEWHDPVRRRLLRKKIPGTDIEIIVPWDRESRQGQFDMYDLDIDVYSLQDDSPGIRLQKLRMLLEQFVMPLSPVIQQVGGQLDVQLILKQAAKFADFPELDEMVRFMEDANPQGQGQQPGMPANTTRTNVRVNRPGATDRGKTQIMQQALLGRRPQGAEMASLGRPSD